MFNPKRVIDFAGKKINFIEILNTGKGERR